MGGDPRDVAGSVAKQFDESGTHWQLGKTKASEMILFLIFKYLFSVQIFLRENLETLLEKEREKQLDAVARIIQAWMIGFLTRFDIINNYFLYSRSHVLLRKRYLKTKQRIVVLQKVYRVRYC